LQSQLPKGTELARVDVPHYDRLFDVVGRLDPDSPAWDAWSAEVERYRRELAEKDSGVVSSESSA
jgi:hypothetical protein